MTTESSGLTSLPTPNTAATTTTAARPRRRTRSNGETAAAVVESSNAPRRKKNHHKKQSASLSAISLPTEEDASVSSRASAGDFHVMVHDDTEQAEEGTTRTALNTGTLLGEATASQQQKSAAASSDPQQSSLSMHHDHSQNTLTSRASSTLTTRRRRRRTAATIRDRRSTTVTTVGTPFPRGQYECTLVRRALYPGPPPPPPNTNTNSSTDYGDTSLGMKLNVTPSGHVVVQHVGCLHDGRASPAQLTVPRIQPGDVLVAIDGVAAAALAALQVLKAPASPNVPCRRQYRLRFAAGEGMAWMRRQQQQQQNSGGMGVAHGSARDPASTLAVAASHSADSGMEMSAAAADTLHSMPSSDLMGLFPMVDQLSGMPLFPEGMPGPSMVEPASPPPPPPPALTVEEEDDDYAHTAAPINTIQEEETNDTVAEAPPSPQIVVTKKKKKKPRPLSMDERISTSLAAARRKDRNFYLLEEMASENETNATTTSSAEPSQQEHEPTLAERHAMGREALSGAGHLLQYVQDYDVRKMANVRSFTSWNTTLSLYSRASTRRRRVLEAQHHGGGTSSRSGTVTTLTSRASTAWRHRRGGGAASIPETATIDDLTDVGIQGSSVGTSSSADIAEGVDGDEVLLRLAARDEIWRTQVLEFLRTVVAQEDDDNDAATNNEPSAAAASGPNHHNPDINSALSNELGNFLFGENMTKILAKHATPRALPPEEVTAVLFDLATRLSSTVPDEIKATGSVLLGDQAGWVPLEETNKDALRVLQKQSQSDQEEPSNDFTKATRFLLDQALPAWIESFRPLGWEHRRMLWPLGQGALRGGGGGGGSTVASSDDDSLTVDSSMISVSRSMATNRRKRKDIRELIEEQELDIETRGETCFLATYYFIHALLPKLMAHKSKPTVCTASDSLDANKENCAETEQQVADFLDTYGSYVKLDTCIAYASALESKSVIDVLLRIAKYDPRHKEVVKQLSKSTSLLFYEPSMLSAIVHLVTQIQDETSLERKEAIVALCAAAYPDVRPWQVQNACANGDADLYYVYLTVLLQPIDGNELAQQDANLVEEWCRRSVQGAKQLSNRSEYHANFLTVASRTSSDHRAYNRDLELLMKLAMDLEEHSLVLDLAGEILEGTLADGQHDGPLRTVLETLRAIGQQSLSLPEQSSNFHVQTTLRRILRLYSKSSFRETFDVDSELIRWMKYHDEETEGSDDRLHRLELVNFLAEEAEPVDVLRALSRSKLVESSRQELLPILRSVLSRGASAGSELSAALLYIKMARQRLGRVPPPVSDSHLSVGSDASGGCSIWQGMASGVVSMEK